MLKVDKRGRLRVSEAAVQRGCIDFLRSEHWIVRPAPKQGQRTRGTAYEVPAGEPDLIAVRWAKHGGWEVLLIECKAKDGRLSQIQWDWAVVQHLPVHVISDVAQLRAVLAGG